MKKIVKKKLNEMTGKDLIQLEIKYCGKFKNCDNCPLNDRIGSACITHFLFWKNQYERMKDKEFEIEVEE